MQNTPKKKQVYKYGEKSKMLKSGYPLCYEKRHCNSCLSLFRKIQDLKKEGYTIHNNAKIH